jgi:hypothetical protein
MSDNCYIKGIIIGGVTSYPYIKYDPDKNKEEFSLKQKGITLDRASSNKFTFESIKQIMVSEGGKLKVRKDVSLHRVKLLKILKQNIFQELLKLLWIVKESMWEMILTLLVTRHKKIYNDISS